MKIISFLNILSLIIIILGLLMLLKVLILGRSTKNIPRKKNIKNPVFCFLLPARDESSVIEGLLKSIKNQTQTINMKDVYVIVESTKDKTVQIAEKYGATVFYRTNLENKRKGYALDECIKEILKTKHYDAYFIFDADNILEKNYLKNMISIFNKGYDIALGYRNTKNGNSNIIAACSSLIFSMLNAVCNQARIKHNKNILISGSGFFITGELVEQWRGFPFHSLTEDYELTLYSAVNNYTTYYCKDAKFYDEQPLTLKKSSTQITRWIKGYIECRREYVPQLKEKAKHKNINQASQISLSSGIKPVVTIVLGIALFLIVNILSTFLGVVFDRTVVFKCLKGLAVALIMIYLVLLTFTIIMFLKENKDMNLSLSVKIKASLFNPIYMCLFVPCALKALFSKTIVWEKTEHINTNIISR